MQVCIGNCCELNARGKNWDGGKKEEHRKIEGEREKSRESMSARERITQRKK